jgi:hypothetical protein
MRIPQGYIVTASHYERAGFPPQACPIAFAGMAIFHPEKGLKVAFSA